MGIEKDLNRDREFVSFLDPNLIPGNLRSPSEQFKRSTPVQPLDEREWMFGGYLDTNQVLAAPIGLKQVLLVPSQETSLQLNGCETTRLHLLD